MKNENDFVAAISTKLSLRTPGGGSNRSAEHRNQEPAGLAQTDFLSWAVCNCPTEARLAQNVMRLTKCRNKSVALKATIYLLQAKFGWGEYAPPSKPPPLGKKEQAQRAAEEGLEDDTEWSTLLQ